MVVESELILKEILSPHHEHRPTVVFYIRKVIKSLRLHHCHILAGTVIEAILSKNKSKNFGGKEFDMIRLVGASINDLRPFNAVVEIISVNIFNRFHPFYEEMIELLGTLLLRSIELNPSFINTTELEIRLLNGFIKGFEE